MIDCHYLSESYKVDPVKEIIFSYIIIDCLASEDRLILKDLRYQISTHSFNNLQLHFKYES